MIVAHNLLAMNAQRQFNITGQARKKSTEKLASGYRVNRSADDAAGLAISEKMRRQIRGLTQTRDNIQDGISFCNVADGALNEISDMLNRIEELTVKSCNGTNTDDDRAYIDKEVQALCAEMEKVFKETSFNEKKIWPQELYPQVGGNANDYSLYKVNDGNGEYYGGIAYMGHRYSWTDLGIDWDETSHTFNSSKTYTIDSKILKDDPSTSIDNYNSTGSSAVFSITTGYGQDLADVQKNYSWSADNDGIRIDGVLVNGGIDSAEGNTTWASMGLIPGQEVKEGTYECTYYGMEVAFEVPTDMDWDDMIGAINSPAVAMDWHSNTIGTSSFSRNVLSSTTVSKVIINNADKDNIAQSYKVVADENKIRIISNSSLLGPDKNTVNKNSLAKTWTQLDNIGADGTGSGQYAIGTWGKDTDGNSSSSKTDAINAKNSDNGSNFISYSSDAKYTFKANSDYITTNGADGGFDFTLRIKDDQSSTNIVNDVDSIYFNVSKTESPVKVTNNGFSKVYVYDNPYSNISFYTQRDILDRQYKSNTETIVGDGKTFITDDGYLGIKFKNYEMVSGTLYSQMGDALSQDSQGLYRVMIDEYNSKVDATRSSKYNSYLSSSDTLWTDLSSVGRYTGTDTTNGESIANEYLRNNFSAETFAALDNDKLKEVFVGINLDGIGGIDLTGSDRTNAIKYAWNGLSFNEKKVAFDKAYTTDTEKNKAFKDDINRNSTNKSWVYNELYNNGRYDSSVDDYNATLDSFIGFSTNDKLAVYKSTRDSYLNMSMSNMTKFGTYDGKTISFRGTQNNDEVRLRYNVSGIKFSDMIVPQSDSQITARINSITGKGLDYDFSEVKESSEINNLLKGYLTDPTISLVGNGESYQNVSMRQTSTSVGSTVINVPEITAKKLKLDIQAGTEAGQHISIEYDNMRLSSLGIRGLHVDTVEGANTMLSVIGKAQHKVSEERSVFGAYTNRLEHAYNVNYNVEENTTAAESLIRDTDMANEMVQSSLLDILSQAGLSMMAQANQSNQGVLSLLQ